MGHSLLPLCYIYSQCNATNSYGLLISQHWLFQSDDQNVILTQPKMFELITQLTWKCLALE